MRRDRRQAFSDLGFVEPLQRLLAAYDAEADLSRFGRHAAHFDVMRCLANLLRFDAAEEADPSICNRALAAPLFITGLPRAATTFLHQLLSLDPANAVPRSWQLIYPYPWRGFDRRRDWVELQLRIFRLLSPGVARLHPLSADMPQECTDITAQVFQSLRFDTTHYIPSYQSWFEAHGHDGAFRFHRRFLRHLDAGGRRWVLKSPDHIFALDAIRRAYPDARFVFLHRDPLSVVASCAKLTEMLRRPFTRALDRQALGRDVAARLVESAGRMSRAHDRDILHLHYRDVVSAPLRAVEAIYSHCDRPLTSGAKIGMRQWLNRRTPQRRRRYDLSEFGLDAGDLRERFAPYMKTFAVPSEWKA